MDFITKSIKIKLEEHSLSREDLDALSRWNNDGGTPDSGEDFNQYVKLPFDKGQIFEVLEGFLVVEDGDLFFEVNINLLAMH